MKADENSSIRKLTNNIGNSFTSRYEPGTSNIKDVISTTIDSLDNDNKLHIGYIFASGYYYCLAQKSTNIDYACGLVFGYGTNNTLYLQIKYNGTWQAVREI